MNRRIALLLVLLVAACGDSTAETTTTTTAVVTTTVVTTTTEATHYPVEVGGVTIETRPERILSGTATHTEILFALGAGDRVVGVDLWSDYPADGVADLPRFDAFNANVEAMAALDPDLVILSFDPGGVVDGLGALGVPVLILDAPVDLEGIFDQFDAIAKAVDSVDEAGLLIPTMRVEITAIVATVLADADGGSYYLELDPALWTITSNTFVGSLFALLGMESIADRADGGSEYPQLSAEFVVNADPDFIFLTHAAWSGSLDTLAQRAGWSDLSAIEAGRVIAVDEALSSRWGPRVVDLLSVLAAAVLEGATP